MQDFLARSDATRDDWPHIGVMQIFTIGYEGATQAAVIEALLSAGVTQLADVRALPLSRRPGFSKNVLAAGLREAGIDYIGLKALGTPPEGREAARRHNHARLAQVHAGQLELPAYGVAGALPRISPQTCRRPHKLDAAH